MIWGNRLDLYDDPTYSGSLAVRTKAPMGREGGDELGESAEFVVKAGPSPVPLHSCSDILKADNPTFGCSAQVFHILPLPDPKDHLEAFNDLALQWVAPERIRNQPHSFWLPEAREGQKQDVDGVGHAVEKLSLE